MIAGGGRDAILAGMEATATAPKRAGLVLGSLIAVAAVANLGLAVANVALPSIGEAFDASQTALNLVAQRKPLETLLVEAREDDSRGSSHQANVASARVSVKLRAGPVVLRTLQA